MSKAGLLCAVSPLVVTFIGVIPKTIAKLKRCGVRIEDDVLITKSGSEILSEGFPKEVEEVEELMALAETAEL